MNPEVDASFSQAKLWREPSERLREILLDCGLDEELKWGKPCYLHEGKNLAILQRMKGFLALMFFKGAFEGLTPGRQRAYDLHFSGAKQSKTREGRIDRLVPKILAGKGLRDR